MNLFSLTSQYISWRIKSIRLHGAHSPFLFNFLTDCVYTKQSSIDFRAIEHERVALKNNKQYITFQDPGAGSKKNQPGSVKGHIKRKIGSIARNSLKSPAYCELFNRMVIHLSYKNILELGTCFGITTSYLGLAGKELKIHTIEGADEIARIAEENFQKIGSKNITLHKGLFNNVLPSLLHKSSSWDMVFIDGDHKGDSLLNYFDMIIKHVSRNGVVIIDDIRWSNDMFDAWKQITDHPDITLTLDFFQLGLAFVNPDLSKENFAVKL